LRLIKACYERRRKEAAAEIEWKQSCSIEDGGRPLGPDYRLSSESPVLQGGMKRVDALCYTVFAWTITKFLHWNTKSVQYPRAGRGPDRL
jgi:hypothetical protein